MDYQNGSKVYPVSLTTYYLILISNFFLLDHSGSSLDEVLYFLHRSQRQSCNIHTISRRSKFDLTFNVSLNHRKHLLFFLCLSRL